MKRQVFVLSYILDSHLRDKLITAGATEVCTSGFRQDFQLSCGSPDTGRISGPSIGYETRFSVHTRPCQTVGRKEMYELLIPGQPKNFL